MPSRFADTVTPPNFSPDAEVMVPESDCSAACEATVVTTPQTNRMAPMVRKSRNWKKITIQLDFLKPFEGHNTAEFTLEPQGGSTKVTWAMYGPSRYITKLISVFVSMDSMVGKDFETGLANLKTVAEKNDRATMTEIK